MTTHTTAEGFSEANKTYFDTIAHQYDDKPHAAERARRTAAALRKAYEFKEDSTTVMEYACGTGLVSRELAPHAKRIVGVDISQGMVDQFNLRVSNQGIPLEEMQAVCAELKGEQGELGDEKFDVIVCASAYHHFTSIDDVTRILAYFLKPGGTLLVVDLAKHTGQHAPHAHGDGVEHGHHDRAHHTHGNGHEHGHHDRAHHTHGNGHEHHHQEGAHHARGDDREHGHHHHHHDHHVQHHPSIPKEFHHLVPHRGGLDEADMRRAFEGAGLEAFSFEDALVDKNNAKLFIAKGIKPGV
ncbi:putative methyltransferase [Lyophyllum shimeji]|uniref:Methyltransferase n=1 Tax=Lyophyllum shimeji TaxID=47721 RepID=A0A9P3PHH1_LYOSH|nr:putative methyltransferase [Lyophyllum shimeji]